MILRVIFQGILAALIALFSNTILASQTEHPANASDKNIYTEEKLNVTVDSKHPTFIIKLKSNPTTGYSWFLREYDAAILTPIKHAYIAPTQKMIGASGVETWTFKVKPAGFAVPQQSIIRLIYARPWQGADNSSQVVFRVTTQGK